MNIESFGFEEINGNLKAVCNHCGQYKKVKYVGSHPYVSDIALFICSDDCLEQFKQWLIKRPERIKLFLALVAGDVKRQNN